MVGLAAPVQHVVAGGQQRSRRQSGDQEDNAQRQGDGVDGEAEVLFLSGGGLYRDVGQEVGARNHFGGAA